MPECFEVVSFFASARSSSHVDGGVVMPASVNASWLYHSAVVLLRKGIP